MEFNGDLMEFNGDLMEIHSGKHTKIAMEKHTC